MAFATTDPRSTAWQRWAACKTSDPALFFTERGQPTTPAKKICARCPVREDCLEYALTPPVERFGIWGGLSERERRRLRQTRRAAS